MATLPDIAAHEQLQYMETRFFKKRFACCLCHIIEKATVLHPFGFPRLERGIQDSLRAEELLQAKKCIWQIRLLHMEQ